LEGGRDVEEPGLPGGAAMAMGTVPAHGLKTNMNRINTAAVLSIYSMYISTHSAQLHHRQLPARFTVLEQSHKKQNLHFILSPHIQYISTPTKLKPTTGNFKPGKINTQISEILLILALEKTHQV
jgi:hypothetical protein